MANILSNLREKPPVADKDVWEDDDGYFDFTFDDDIWNDEPAGDEWVSGRVCRVPPWGAVMLLWYWFHPAREWARVIHRLYFAMLLCRMPMISKVIPASVL